MAPGEGAEMSGRLMERVLESASARGIPRLVLLAIASHARDEATECWPSLSRLVELTGLDRVTVWKAIEKLEEIGDLTVSRDPQASRHHRANRYLVHPGRARGADHLEGRGADHLELGEESNRLGEERDEARCGNHLEPGIEPGREPRRENARADAPEAPRAMDEALAENYMLATDPAVPPDVARVARKHYLRLGGIPYGLEREEAVG
jgi:hypothetical protein